MRKVLLFALLAALLASTGYTQSAARDLFAGLQYDVDSTSLYYCTTLGPMQTGKLIKTSGSSTTIVSAVASSSAFLGMAAGDVLSIQTAASTYATRVVVTWTNADTIVVDTAITIPSTGQPFQFWRNTCGTAVTDGWFSVPASAQRVSATVLFEQGDIATLSARWECKPTNSGSVVVIYPGESSDCGLGGALSTDRCDFAQAVSGTATGSLTIVDDAPVFGFCRVGLAYKTSDAADTTTALEKITVAVAVR